MNMSEDQTVIPENVDKQLRQWFKLEPRELLSRRALMFNGKSAFEFIADGGTWDEVRFRYDRMTSFEVTQ